MSHGFEISDLYIPGEGPEGAFAYPGPIPAREQPEVLEIAERLWDAALKTEERAFQARAGDTIFRCQKTRTLRGTVMACRKLNTDPAPLQSLLDRGICEILLSPELREGGVVIIAGGPGQGKTTTLAALISTRLSLYGGVCVAAEDPPEIPLDGAQGQGYCIQIPVTETEPLEKAIHTALRLYPVSVPALLMVGEIRGRAAAEEALVAGLNGCLVVFTLHAGSPQEAIERFIAMAGGDETARSAVASALRIVIHQKLERAEGKKPKAVITPLVIQKEAFGLRSNIRDGKLGMLSTEIQMQGLSLKQGRSIPV